MVFDPFLKKRYWAIARRLSTAQLQKDSGRGLSLSDEDFFNLDIGRRGHDYFLGFYSKSGLDLVFQKYGVFKTFAQLGFKNIDFSIDTKDPYKHRLTVHDLECDPSEMLVELIVKKTLVTIDVPFATSLNGREFETLAIEWLCMQNPRARFTKSRPQFPGQKYPGLGMASKVVELLLIIVWRLKMAGLVNIPDHYHNAYLYSKIFYYMNPEYQARLKAMIRDMRGYNLETVAWAMIAEAVIDKKTGQPLKWFVAQQIAPLDQQLKTLFQSRDYKEETVRHMKNFEFYLDESKYKQYMEKRRNQ